MHADYSDAPWLAAAWAQWNYYQSIARIPQGLLITGPAGLGKQLLAYHFAQGQLCQQPHMGRACTRCSSCLLMAAGNHPDFFHLSPLDDARRITIDQMRQLIGQLALAPQYPFGRVVMIAPADAMNVQSANSLLKTLEEPDQDTSFLLVSDQPHRLPATLRSRCQRMNILLPTQDVTRTWLIQQGLPADEVLPAMAAAMGAPRLALEAQGRVAQRQIVISQCLEILQPNADTLMIAEAWSKIEGLVVLVWLQSFLHDLVRVIADPACSVQNLDFCGQLLALRDHVQLATLFRLLDSLPERMLALEGQANRQLIMESCVLDMMQLLPMNPTRSV